MTGTSVISISDGPGFFLSKQKSKKASLSPFGGVVEGRKMQEQKKIIGNGRGPAMAVCCVSN